MSTVTDMRAAKAHRPEVRATRRPRTTAKPAPLPVPPAERAAYNDALMRLTVALSTDMPVVTVTRADLRLLIAQVHADHAAAKRAEQDEQVAA